MFMSEYNHTIDAKGRLIIPSKFRDKRGDEFVVTKGLDGCLFVYDKAEWSVFEEKLTALSITNRESRKVLRFFFGRLRPTSDWQEKLVAKFREDFGDSL